MTEWKCKVSTKSEEDIILNKDSIHEAWLGNFIESKAEVTTKNDAEDMARKAFFFNVSDLRWSPDQINVECRKTGKNW